jgi:hypothetical protein
MKDYAIYRNNRKIRKSQVNKLKSALLKGTSYPPIAVNIKDGKKWLLDGNHRYVAIKELLMNNPNAEITIWEQTYNIKHPAEEIDKFIELNSGCNVTTDDFVQQYRDEVPFIKELLKHPQVSVYGSTSRPFKARGLLASYFLCKEKMNYSYTLTVTKIIKSAGFGNSEDLRVIHAFIKEYQDIFGKMDLGSIWLKTTVFFSMFKIWYLNKERVRYDIMLKRFRRLINHQYILEYSKLGGRDACSMAIERFLEVLNRGRGIKFISNFN